jgi:NAD-dependent dihydropyrimidine dehydrogenase PreA subunit
VSRALLEEVIPDADRFSGKEGEPPVYRAYRVDPATGAERLLGYAFLTSDLPPEVIGYLGPIRVLVGLDVEGVLTGVRVVWHREPLSSSRRGFLEDPLYVRQFSGKHVGDPFRLRSDLRGVSGATMSVEAMALGIRNAARRVASAHRGEALRVAGEDALAPGAPAGAARWAELSWFELVARGLVKRLEGEVDGMARLEIFFTPLWEEGVGEVLLGPDLFARALRRAGDRAEEDQLMFLGLEGQNLAWFRPNLFFVVQGADTLRASLDDVVLFRDLRAGTVAEQLGAAGIWMLDRRIDMSRPFTVGFGGEVGLTLTSIEHPGRPGRGGEAVTATDAGGRGADPPGVEEHRGREGATADADPSEGGDAHEEDRTAGELGEGEDAAVAAGTHEPGPAVPEGGPARSGAGQPDAPPDAAAASSPGDASVPLDLYHVEEESRFARTLARTSWSRVGGLLLLLLVATIAFSTKSTPLRWTTLAGTVLFLGFVDRGFLSISHLSSAMVVGPGLFLSDLSLLLLVLFTVATTVFWGRIFCGYLCPFGVLQDLLDRFVPRRFRRRMPSWIHDRALWVKYGILVAVLTPAFVEVVAPRLIRRDFSIYQYVEPFGTVFFRSPSVLLWALALGFLAASAVVPRFYCRYVCPLGAALAVVSRVAPFRIRRVEQCTVCKVCEQSCPTGAIRGHEVDFPECVRCSVCEVKLIERAGTCRHEMENVRPRLIQIQVPARRETE